MKRKLLIRIKLRNMALLLLIGCTIFIGGCGKNNQGKNSSKENSNQESNNMENSKQENSNQENSNQENSKKENNREETSMEQETKDFITISQKEAKQIMEEDEDVIILDVRTKEEFDTGHIKNAILLPYDEIHEKAKTEIPDKNGLILIYCRSGNRSKIAAKALVDMGYTNIREFGGISSWEYETVR